MSIVPSSAVATYNDQTTDTYIYSNVPLLFVTGRVDGRLSGGNGTGNAPDGYDFYAVDFVGGTHDSSGSLGRSQDITVTYQLDGPGSIDLSGEISTYSNYNNGVGGGTVFKGYNNLSGSGSVTFSTSSWSTYPGDVAFFLTVGAIETYTGTYHLTFSVGGVTPPPPATPTQQDHADSARFSFDGHSYQYISFNSAAHTWDESNAMATALGGYLATITSQAENDFITNNIIPGHLIAGLSGAFIGGTDAGHEGLWTWATGPEAGQAFQYTHWAPGEPNGNTSENYGFIGADGQWVDVATLRDPAFTTGFIVEYPTVTGAGGGHGVADFNKNGMSDLVWYNQSNNDTETWLLNSGKWAGSVDIGKHPAGYMPAGTGDFNKDGTTDIFWFNPSTHDTDIWLVNNGGWSGSTTIGQHPAGSQVAGTADFNRDGTTDVLWFNPSTLDTEIWLVNNGTWAGTVSVGKHPAGYQVAGVADFNKDGNPDIFWFNPTTRDTDIWLLNNGKWSASTTIGLHPAGYQVAGVGDFNKDGTSDVLWYNPTTHDTDIWLLNNGKWAGSVTIGQHPGDYQVGGIGDFNNDGTSDVLWVDPATNAIDVWFVSNGHWAGSTTPGAHPAGWGVI